MTAYAAHSKSIKGTGGKICVAGIYLSNKILFKIKIMVFEPRQPTFYTKHAFYRN